MIDYELYKLGDIELQSGEVLPDASLAYKTYGRLNEKKNNVIVFPTYYTGTHKQNERIIGPEFALNSSKYFIIVPDMFGNGVSSSPSNTASANGGANFPNITVYDNVLCQRRLLEERWGIEQIALVTGWSVGALQAFQWATLYPDSVKRLLAVCGAARISNINFVFLDGAKAALTADPVWQGGKYTTPPEAGLKAFGRVYAGWTFSQAFYGQELFKELGFDDLEAFLQSWEQDHLKWDANDLLAMLWTWQHANASDNQLYLGDFEKALRSIKARTVIMPSATDLYFHTDDNRYEASLIPGAEYKEIPSIWGHYAGGPGRVKQDVIFIENALRDILNEEA